MNNLSIKVKLILIFILIKILPLLLISYIAYKGAMQLDSYVKNSTKKLSMQSKEIIFQTANSSIEDSIKNLDKKSQHALERLSYEIANNIANFLYQRDEDILFLSKLNINEDVLKSFYESKKRDIIVHDDYIYNKTNSTWERKKTLLKENRRTLVLLEDNKEEFNYFDPIKFKKIKIPIYKEVSYFNLEGKEIYKVSSLNPKLLDISKKKNTYVNSEVYFDEIKKLKRNEIYVSNVIGENVKTKIIGKYTKEKTDSLNMKFEPRNSAYAGLENPNGKKFQGIVRFITPVFKESKKIGFLSLALDHEHIMQFTDTSNPTSLNARQDIADASKGNYAFMWDYIGRNISHPRDYLIYGYDKNTGKGSMPWLSKDLAKKFYKSNLEINEFLSKYPPFEEQSLSKKPNLKQVKDTGDLGIDCRYLNFAPQCQGWMEVTKNGGYGSFLIYFSKVWKLSTAASIPYYTGQYSSTKRGFGFVTIGANVDEFHAAASKTKSNVEKILKEQSENFDILVKKNELKIDEYISSLINELSFITIFLIILIVFIALWLSSYISNKIKKILLGTKKFANNDLSYRIEVSSKDEIGKLESSFNKMANKIQILIKKEKDLNESLEKRVQEELKKQREQEHLLIQQARLASMGEMIANIAHQWRQPLNALSLVIQNINFANEIGELDNKFLDKSNKKAHLLISNMSRTIDDFRNFFKPNKLKQEFSLWEVFDESVKLLEATFMQNEIKLEKISFKQDIKIYGYKNEFIQVILNILNNAKDALISNKIENKKIEIDIYTKDKLAYINISDNAKGINPKILHKIFDPYFTTKEEGNGTGIGLYMAKIIIEKNMSGKLFVSNNSFGASFIISLPLSNNTN